MAGNQFLLAANRAKQDEFYTQLPDIEKELKHYRKHFRGKTVYCNCDDPTISNFFLYFHLNFAKLGLKRLIVSIGRILTDFSLLPNRACHFHGTRLSESIMEKIQDENFVISFRENKL